VVAAKARRRLFQRLCHLDPEKAEEFSQAVKAMADEGLRVLGVAKAYFRRASLRENSTTFKSRLLRLVGLEDPVRPTVAGL